MKRGRDQLEPHRGKEPSRCPPKNRHISRGGKRARDVTRRECRRSTEMVSRRGGEKRRSILSRREGDAIREGCKTVEESRNVEREGGGTRITRHGNQNQAFDHRVKIGHTAKRPGEKGTIPWPPNKKALHGQPPQQREEKKKSREQFEDRTACSTDRKPPDGGPLHEAGLWRNRRSRGM